MRVGGDHQATRAVSLGAAMRSLDDEPADAPAQVRRRGINCLKATAPARDHDSAAADDLASAGVERAHQLPRPARNRTADHPAVDDGTLWPRLLVLIARRVRRPEARRPAPTAPPQRPRADRALRRPRLGSPAGFYPVHWPPKPATKRLPPKSGRGVWIPNDAVSREAEDSPCSRRWPDSSQPPGGPKRT